MKFGGLRDEYIYKNYKKNLLYKRTKSPIIPFLIFFKDCTVTLFISLYNKDSPSLFKLRSSLKDNLANKIYAIEEYITAMPKAKLYIYIKGTIKPILAQ